MSVKLHAKFSASASERWLKCPGSIRLSQGIPNVESRWAKEGTNAHECLEFLVNHRRERGKAILFLRKKYPESMIIHAQMALDELERRMALVPGSELFVEVKAHLPVDEPDQFGTADLVLVEHFGKLTVMDYKYGAGIPVSVSGDDGNGNPQLIYYALGVAHRFHYNFSEIECVIIQPRAPIGGHFVRSWSMQVEGLDMWREKFNQGIKTALKKNAPLLAGEKHCRFCPAKNVCPEVGNLRYRQAQADFADPYEDDEPKMKKRRKDDE